MVNKRGRNDFDENENNEFQPDYNTGTYRPKRAALRVDNDETFVPNIMEMSTEDRIDYIKQNGIDSYNYPQHYKDLIKKEMSRRNLQGFENLKNITHEKVFQRTSEQYGRLTRIQNLRNVNCIKSRDMSEIDMNNFEFTDKAMQIFKDHNVEVPPNFSEYIDYYRSIHGVSSIYNDEDDINKEYLQKFPHNKYQLILNVFSMAFGDLSQYVCVAGGFALSMYIYQNYGYSVGFSDIDLFIHSCDQETANEIVSRLRLINGINNVHENPNVVSIDVDYLKNGLLNFRLFDDGKTNKLSIQIIKRLYTCPQQVITGFDVDSCCILTTLDGQIYTTERGYNSIERGYNVINFDRYSPSYMYRLLKYNKRGFGIWIPFMSHFKENAIFDVEFYNDKSKQFCGSTILIKGLINNDIINVSDYYKSYTDMYEQEYGDFKPMKKIEFQELDVTKQTINTFNRIYLSDPKSWYPELNMGVKLIDMVPSINNIGHEIIEIFQQEDSEIIYARNIIRTTKVHKNVNYIYDDNYNEDTKINNVVESSSKLLNYIHHILPDVITCGYLPQNIITCKLRKKYTNDLINNCIFYSKSLVTEENKFRFMYEITKYRILINLFNTIFYNDHDKSIGNMQDLNELGTIMFLNQETGETNTKEPESEEENFYNYMTINNKTKFRNFNSLNDYHMSKQSYESVEEFQDRYNKNLSYLNSYNYVVKVNENVNYIESNHSTRLIRLNFTFMNSENSFESELNDLEKDEDRGFFFSNGKFYGCNYEYQKTSILVNNRNSKILDYPVVDNYVPS